MEEKSKLFYDDLVGAGYKLPDYETFKTSLQDQSKADAFYKDLSSSGFKLPDFDTFYGVFKPIEADPQPIVQQPVERIPTNGIADFIGNINQTILKIPADIAETWAIASAFTERQLAKTGLPGADPNIRASDVSLGFPITKVTDEYRGMVESIAPVSEEFKGTFAGGVSQGLGQAAGMLLSGGGSRATGLVKMAKSTGGSTAPIISAGKDLLKNVGSRQGLIGGSMNASANYRQAIDDGATEEEALRYGIENMVVGSVMENLPIQSMFSRISKMEPGAKILDVVKNGLVGAGEEAVTEGFQTTYENLSAERIYDLQKNMLDGVGDAAAVGGTVGFLLNSAMSALVGRRAKAKSPKEEEVLDQAIEETQAKINTVEENNKKVEETVTALENTKSRTLNNGATDLEFIENPDGSIELSEDGLTAPDAESKKLLLEKKYPNVEFQIVDNTDKGDPYAEANFTIVGRPKTNAKYSKGQDVLSKNQAQFLIEGATTVNELEGLNIENDPELEQSLQSKIEELNVGQPEVITEQPAIEEPGTEGQIAPEIVPEEPIDQGVDIEVPIKDSVKSRSEPAKEPSLPEKITLSHFTTKANSDKIKEQGFKSLNVGEEGRVFDDVQFDGAIYLTDDAYWNEGKKNDMPEYDSEVVVEVDNKNVVTLKTYEEFKDLYDRVSAVDDKVGNFAQKAKSLGIDAILDLREESDASEFIVTNPDIIKVKEIADTSTGKPPRVKPVIPASKAVSERKAKQKIIQPVKDGKTKQKTTPGKSPGKKDDGRPKARKPSQKGRVPLDQRALKGKELQAAKLTPNTIQESVLSWFVNGGRLSYDGLQSLFGQQKQGSKKSIQGEFNARRSYMRTPEKGGKGLDVIAEEILNDLPEELYEKAQADPTALRNAIESAISENSSIAQMANSMLSGRGIDSKASKQLPPVEDRSRFTQDAIRETFTPEEWADMSSQEKADFFNEYFQYPKGSEYEYTAEMIEESEGVNFENDQREDDIDFLSVMSNDELVEFEKGYKGVEAEFAPEGTKIDTQKQKVKDLANDLIRQIKEDKQGIIVDFEARAKADIKFFNTLKNLVIEYSRLRGMQFNQFISDIEKLFNAKLSQKNRDYLKELWGAGKRYNRVPKTTVEGRIEKQIKSSKISRKLDTLVNAYTELKRSLRERSKAARVGKKSEADRVKLLKSTLNEFLDENKKEIDSLGIKLKTQILKKVNAVNSEASLLSATNYIEKIVNKHSLRKEYLEAIGKVQQAKKNIKAGKQGVVESNSNLRKLLNVNPKIVPSSEIEAYNALMDTIGARKTVLSLPEKGKLYKEVDRLLQSIEDDTTRLFELAEIYESAEKVTKDVNGVKKVSYSETVDQLLEDGTITASDAQLMKRRKTEIIESSRELKAQLSDAQINELINDVLTKNLDGDKKSLTERLPSPSGKYDPKENDIIRLFRTLKAQDLLDLVTERGGKKSVSQIIQLQKVLDNIENDFVPHLSERLRTKIQANRNARNNYDIIKNYNGNPLEWISRSKAFIKNLTSPKSTSTLQERIKSIPTYAIDQAFRNFKDSRLYEVIFRKVAQGQEFTKSDLNNMSSRIEVALNKIPALKQWEQMMITGMYRLDRMSKANPNLPTLDKWIEKTLSPSSIYNDSAQEKIEEIYNSLLTDGAFDPKKAEKAMLKESKELNDLMDEIYENELAPKVAVTSSLIRGKEAKYVPAYTPTPETTVKGAKKRGGKDSDISDYINKVLNTSTKGGTSEEKTGSAHALDLNPVNGFLWSAKETLLDYHMTSVYREAMQTIDAFEKLAKTKADQKKAIDLRAMFTQDLQSLLMKSYSQDNFFEKVFKGMEKKAYQALLGGFTRPVVDFSSNVMYASIWKPTETARGLDILWKYKDQAGLLSNIAKFAKSTELTRMYDSVGLSSKYGDSAGAKGIKTKSTPPTGLDKILDKTKVNKLENLYESFDKFNNFSTSAPDQIVARALFHGVFDTEFNKITGKQLDYEKMSSGDLDYLEDNFDAISKASLEADKQVNEGFSSSNELLGVIKNQKLPSDNLLAVWYKNFDRFMTKFTIGEHVTSVKAIKAMMGNGEISRAEGLQLLAAQTARMVTYQTMISTLPALVYGGILTALGYKIKSWNDEEDEETKEKEKDKWYNEMAQALVQVAVMLGLQRNLGNMQKGLLVDPVVEYMNQKYGEGVTYKGTYNPYEDQITFPLFSTAEPRITDRPAENLILRTSGPATVQLRPLFDALNNNKLRQMSTDEEKKEMYSARMQANFLQLLGSTGFVPAYRDFNNLYKRSLYDTEKTLSKEAEKRKDGKAARKFGER